MSQKVISMRSSTAIAALFSASLLVFSGCATVVRGTDQDFRVETVPYGAQVKTSNGFSCDATPCIFKVKRKSEFTVNITKQGCEPVSVPVSNKVSNKGAVGVAGNVLAGGVIGLGVDAATGAARDLHPNPVKVALVCEGDAEKPE